MVVMTICMILDGQGVSKMDVLKVDWIGWVSSRHYLRVVGGVEYRMVLITSEIVIIIIT